MILEEQRDIISLDKKDAMYHRILPANEQLNLSQRAHLVPRRAKNMHGLLLFQCAIILIFHIYIISPIISYLRDPKRLRRFPSVSVAALTNGWAVLHQYRHTRTVAVHEAHQRYGEIVRVGPTHLSFATIQAIKDMYGHGTKATKDHFYRALESTHLNVSDSQDRAVHSIKRRRFAQSLAQKSIVELEGMMQPHLKALIAYIDQRYKDPDSSWEVDVKFVILATLYDLNSVVMFSHNPRFLERETLVCPAETITGDIYTADMYQAFLQGGRVSSTVGWAPKSARLLRALSWWHGHWKAGGEGRDITIHLLRRRMKMDTDRIKSGKEPMDDLMTTLLWDKQKHPLCLEFGEIITEAINMFSAAGENTEIGTTNVVYLLARHPPTATKLRQELDAVLGHDRTAIPSYDKVKDLPYLRACIDEGLRLRPSIELGLPRIVPKGGMCISGEWLEEGTTISVSTRTIHRDPTIFGENPNEFVPERWLRENSPEMQRGYLAFSQGGRACVGRNIALFEMQLIIATLFWKYDLKLPSPDWELEIREGFSAHTLALPMEIHARS